jgi:hypothetical protein
MRWALVLLVACGGSKLSPKAAKIREASDMEIADCTFVKRVRGEGSDQTDAKHAALEKAAAAGATHVTWFIPCCTTVEADAYRCDAPPD